MVHTQRLNHQWLAPLGPGKCFFWSFLTNTKQDQAPPSHANGKISPYSTQFWLWFCSIGTLFLGHPVVDNYWRLMLMLLLMVMIETTAFMVLMELVLRLMILMLIMTTTDGADVDLQGQHWQRDSVWWSTGDPGSCIIFFFSLLYSGGHGDHGGDDGNLLE